MDLYFYILLFTGFFSILYINTGDEEKKFPTFSLVLSVLLSVFVIYELAFFPMVIYDDKSNYLNLFRTISFEKALDLKDKGFGLYVYLTRSLFSNENLFFILTAFIYVLGYWIFALKTFSKKYVFVFLLMVFVSFGFTGYGVNTIRAGFGMGMLLIAFSNRENKILFFLFGILAVSSHKSMVLPFAFFILSQYVNRPKLYLRIWLLALIISFVNVAFITTFLQENLFSFDDRAAGYFDETKALHYKKGFRWDFVVYSALPILISFYYLFKLKLNDKFYNQLFNTYLLTNAIWLLVIRMAFTDRVAYLSWFLIPFLVLYPLLKYNLPINQRKGVALILLGTMAFTTYMYLI